jgi:hypothetical protein
MDQEADRRGIKRLAAPRPLLERPAGRPAEGVERDCAEFARKPPDHAAAEPVERMTLFVSRLGRGSEGVPALAPRHADENDGPRVRERSLPLGLGKAEGGAGDQACALDRGKDCFDRHAAITHRGIALHDRDSDCPQKT